jgi:hypothetical protein
MDYLNVGILVVVFVLQLIILLYMVWIYNQFVVNMNDCEDLLISIYMIEIAELRGKEVSTLEIPKRIRERIEHRKK